MIQIFGLYIYFVDKMHIMSFKSWLRVSGDSGVPVLGLGSWSWFGYGHWSLITPRSKFWLTILILKVQRISMSLKSWIWGLESKLDSLLGYGIVILIWLSLLFFDTPMIQILTHYLNFVGAKNIHVFHVLIWGFGGCWRLLTGIWGIDIDLDMVKGLWYAQDPNFGSLTWFWRCKEHQCPLNLELRHWKTLEVPDRV